MNKKVKLNILKVIFYSIFCFILLFAIVLKRLSTTVDMFPTILSALGFEIDGDRLGLGVDLFSETKTFSEEMGVEQFNEEMSKYSRYYIENFS